MRAVSADTTNAWKASFKGGTDRGFFRATIQKITVTDIPYEMTDITDHSTRFWKNYGGTGHFRSIPFGSVHQPIELPNIATVHYEKGVHQDIATCTIGLFNTDPLPLGEIPEDNLDYERPGYYTFNRGVTSTSVTRWGHSTNGWRDILIPDRVIRLYEGYGYNASVGPEDDANLYPAGLWMIDDVTYTTDGMIMVSCRDIGRVLLDSIYYPPIVPFPVYPLAWDVFSNVADPPVIDETDTTKWFRPTYEKDSNLPYVGLGLTDGGRPYVENDGEVRGHGGRDAFDGSMTSYWMSVGNFPSWSSAFEFVQGKFSSRTVSATKVTTWGGPYRMYISVFADGAWKGRRKIPYHARQVDTNANIRYVKAVRIGKNETKKIKLPRAYDNATKIRVTFTDLYNSGIGYYKYRAGVKDIKVRSGALVTSSSSSTSVDGNYADYTDIVKWLLAWTAFYWPAASTGKANYKQSDGDVISVPPPSTDPIFPAGRVWGDFMQTNAWGPATLGYPIFNQKSIMDCISIIREIMNFIFMVDETGGVVWRTPNIWGVGNFLNGSDGGARGARTSTLIEIDERETLLSMSTRLSSRAVRDGWFVGNSTGKVGAFVPGFDPAQAGLSRIAGWTDQYLPDDEQAQIMADLLRVRAMFEYRTNSLTIPGYPALQVDDQVRIFERITGEAYVHYVRGITCDWDIRTGRYTYTLDTHWLGESPATNWIVDPTKFDAITQSYLNILLGVYNA